MHARSIGFSLAATLALAVVAGVSLANPGKTEAGAAGEHPYFKNQGTLSWSRTLADAQAAAKASDKLIFIEYGREKCGNCKNVCENVLPDAKVKERMGALCIGLAAECDKPENDVQALMRDNLKNANILPFCGFVTADLKWVAGFNGSKSVEEFDAILAEAEKSPLLQAKPENVKKLEGFLAQATKGSEKGDWKSVFAAQKAATEIKGRAPVRDKITELVTKAREYAETELSTAATTLTSGGDRAAVRASLKKLAGAFSGEPEQKDAEAGLKVIDKLGVIEGLPAEQQDAARAKAVKELAGSRWVALFEKK